MQFPPLCRYPVHEISDRSMPERRTRRARDTGMDEAVCVPGLARTDQLIDLPLALRCGLALDDEEPRGPVRVRRFELSQPRLDRTHARAPWFPIGSLNFLMLTNRSRSRA